MNRIPGPQMHAATRSVLEYVQANPGCTRDEAVQALPKSVNVKSAFCNLVYLHYIEGAGPPSGKQKRYFETRSAPRVVKPSTDRAVDPITAPRPPVWGSGGTSPSGDALSRPWTEPYLTDVGVRKEGLEYRNCPSRRGTQLVYCYRRAAP